jgi:glycosyltransferase involved in cell wall biosynthesis
MNILEGCFAKFYVNFAQAKTIVEPHPFKSDEFCIVTIAFNNYLAIEKQIGLLKRFLLDNYILVVADNSSEDTQRSKILKVCREKQVNYIGLPRTVINFKDPSFSHGLAMNWIFKNYLKIKPVLNFGFIDHDVYPLHKTTILNKLKSVKCWGLVQEREDKWYLWAGFCFFNKRIFTNNTANFLPVKGLDTGGGNWEGCYSNIDKVKLVKLPHYYIDKVTGESVKYFNQIQNKVQKNELEEIIGDWVHTFNGSKWRKR